MLPFGFFRLGSLFAALWFAVGQQALGSFEAVKQTLGLNDAQVTELQRNLLRSRQEDVRQGFGKGRTIVIHFPEGMDDAHSARLSEISKVLEYPGVAAMAIDIGLIRPEQWPGGYGSMCHYPFDHHEFSPYLSAFGMTGSQIQQLAAMMRVATAPLWPQVREKSKQRQALLESGAKADSPAVAQLDSDLKKLEQQISAKPSRDLVMSVLDSTQKAKLAEFEKQLELVREAVELGLIYDPFLNAEVLCL